MRKINFDYIPVHTKCINCGECCGPVPISEKEYKEIKKYCIENNIEPYLKLNEFDCPFRDHKRKKCNIYPVRPDMCKLFGVTKGMTCSNGNSCNIDGYKYILKDPNKDINGIKKLANELFKVINKR